MAEIKRIFDLLTHIKTSFEDKEDVFGTKIDGKWVKYSAEDYLYSVNTIASGLLKLGIKKGDNIATIMGNRPEWNFLDLALMKIGAIQIPIYPTISTENYKYIFEQAQVKLVFVNDEEIYNKINSFVHDLSFINEIYSIDEVDGLKHLDELIQLGKENSNISLIEEISNSISEEDVATIIYTSGTTGFPKGVMLSHKNFVFNFMSCVRIIQEQKLERALSFLPLCHVYERMLNYMYQYRGIAVYYAESIEKVGENIKEVSPGIFCAVPRVLEKTFDKIMAKGRDLKGIKRLLFFWAVSIGEEYDHFGNSAWYEFRLSIARKLIFSKWMEALGGEINVVVSGGAPLQDRLARIFWAVGIQVMEGYGLTETSPLIAVNLFEKGGVMIGTVGPVLDGVEVKFAPDGEILAKGPNIMKGYFDDEEKTNEVIDDEGFFHTGDIGKIVNEKFLKITDRKKEIFKSSGGKYIAPQPIENKLKESPFIENIMLVGENRNFASAIIIPEFNHLESYCKIKGYEFGSKELIVKNEIIIKRFQKVVDKYNKEFDKVEQIKKFILLPDDWSVETDFLSPTLKLKRRQLVEKYTDLIEEIYQ